MNSQHGASKTDLEVAEGIIQKKLQGSRLLTHKNLYPIPCFHISELTLGEILGYGQFCNVYEIRTIHKRQDEILNCSIPNDIHNIFRDTNGNDYVAMIEKKKMESNIETNQNGEGQQFVIKCLKPELKSMKKLFAQGLLDLTIETKILSALRHPNIIKICGSAKYSVFHHDYFIVLERLNCTLQDKFELWKDENHNRSFLRKMLHRKSTKIKKAACFRNKLGIFRELSSAISYIHSHRYVITSSQKQCCFFHSAPQ